MSTMPHWLSKTPHMVAMDRYFSASPNLIHRYMRAIASIRSRLPTSSEALDTEAPGTSAAAFSHFGTHWINQKNPSSGGDYWPHVPTFTIIAWLEHGIVAGAQKGLGSTELTRLGENPVKVFDAELSDGMKPNELENVLPLVTSWVCTSPPGTGTVEVDAIRGPSVVELIISTPWPKTMQSRVWSSVKPVIDEQWVRFHGG